MGWISTITDAATSVVSSVTDEAEKVAAAAKAAAEAAANATKEAAEKAAQLAAQTAATAKAAAEAAANATKEAAEKAAQLAAQLAAQTAVEAKEAAEAAANATKEAVNETGNSFVHATNVASSAAVVAWSSTSDEAQALSSVVTKEGLVIGNGFISGATVIGSGIEEGAEIIGKGAVALGDYISDHACDIALGSALSAVFVALAADGEEEVSVGSIAALAATGFVNKAALDTAAKALAFIIVEPVFAIPGVSKSVGHKSEFESAISFLIVKACSSKPELVVGSGGQFLAGVLIYGITSIVCEGKVPGGFVVWKGAQASL